MRDQKIIQYLHQRSEEGFRLAEQSYGAYLKRIAMNVLDNREDAEECIA